MSVVQELCKKDTENLFFPSQYGEKISKRQTLKMNIVSRETICYNHVEESKASQKIRRIKYKNISRFCGVLLRIIEFLWNKTAGYKVILADLKSKNEANWRRPRHELGNSFLFDTGTEQSRRNIVKWRYITQTEKLFCFPGVRMVVNAGRTQECALGF